MTRRGLWFGTVAVAPIVAFYSLLAIETVNIPFLDDYTGVLGFISAWSQLGTIHEKTMLILTSQHNEYKLIFANLLYVFQYLTVGHINFAVLSTVGNLLLLPLYLVIYRMWSGDRRVITDRVMLFAPVSWVFFQLQYYSLLNWPMSSLQHIAVILFSLLTIYLLSKDQPRAFALSFISLALAIASSGNGFFVIPIGCLMLIQFRRPMRILCWLAASATILAFYLFRYNFNASQTHADHSIISSLHHISTIYALSFLGASIAKEGSYLPAAILGSCLCAIFIYAAVDRLYLRNPAIFYSVCFILVTAVAVSGLRSDLGISQSLVSRYRIYSNLMLIFVYLYGVGKLMDRIMAPHPAGDITGRGDRSMRLPLAASIAIAVALFNVGSNYAGFRLLRARTELTKQGMRRWELQQQSITDAPSPANEDPVIRRQRLAGIYEPLTQPLREAEDLHVYSPPSPPSDTH